MNEIKTKDKKIHKKEIKQIKNHNKKVKRKFLKQMQKKVKINQVKQTKTNN